MQTQVLKKQRKWHKVVQVSSVGVRNAIESKRRENTVNREKTRLKLSQTHKKTVNC